MSRRSPASSATRSQCRPAQLMRKSPSKSPAGVSATHPLPDARRRSTRAPVWTRGAARGQFGHQRLADLRVIDDAFLRNPQRRHAAHVRLDLAHGLASQPLAALPGRWPLRALRGRAGAELRSRPPPPPACRRPRAARRSPGRTPPSAGFRPRPAAPWPSRACNRGRNAARRCCGRSGAGPRCFPFRAR